MRRIRITQEDVRQVLEKSASARNNDLSLMVEVLTNKGLPTDIKELQNITATNILETIRRNRCLVVNKYPYLKPIEKTQVARNEYEEIMKEEVSLWNIQSL